MVILEWFPLFAPVIVRKECVAILPSFRLPSPIIHPTELNPTRLAKSSLYGRPERPHSIDNILPLGRSVHQVYGRRQFQPLLTPGCIHQYNSNANDFLNQKLLPKKHAAIDSPIRTHRVAAALLFCCLIHMRSHPLLLLGADEKINYVLFFAVARFRAVWGLGGIGPFIGFVSDVVSVFVSESMSGFG